MTPTNDRDDDLRRALHDAVSEVRPRDALDQIRSRTDKVVTMNNSANRRWLLPTIAVAAVMAAVIGGAFWMTRDDDPSGAPVATPSQTPTSDTSPSQSAEPDLVARAVPVYFVGETAHGPKLYREFQRQQVCEGEDCLLAASIVSATSGAPLDSDYSSPWPDDTKLNGASFVNDVLTIDLAGDLHDRPSGMSRQLAELAVEQLIYSAQAAVGQRPPVQILLDGAITDQVLGVPTSEPLAAGAEDDVLAPVWINTPAEGATVESGFTVDGVAMSFEATVVWQLKQGENVVEEGFTTAEECCTRAPYSFTVDAAPGDYTLVVQDDDPSGGEGPGVSPDTKEITVR